MPHYDESFIHDDNQNQKRNKRSYHVYKTGLSPISYIESNDVIHALEGRGTNVIKRNIINIKQRGRYKPETSTSQSNSNTKCKKTDFIVSHCPPISVFDPRKLYDIRNNNVVSLTPCKSFDNLTLRHGKRDISKDKMRNGTSLQNLIQEDRLKHFISPIEDCQVARKGDVRNSYSVVEARRRPIQRRFSRTTANPGVGVYRKIYLDGTENSNNGILFYRIINS